MPNVIGTMTSHSENMPNEAHTLTCMSGHRAKCKCGWTYALDESSEYGTLAAKDKLIDAHRNHIFAVEEYKCGLCNGDRRSHDESSHKWRPKE